MVSTPTEIISFTMVRLDYSEDVTSPAPIFTTSAQKSVVIIGWILSIQATLIIFTNLLMAIALFLLMHKGGSSSWSFVLNLAIADILVGLAITAIATDAIKGRAVSIHKEVCLLRMCFIIMPSAASIFTMFFISLDRYVAIKVPLRYSQLMGTKMTVSVLVFLWLLSMVVGFLPNMVKNMQSSGSESVCTFFSVIDPQSIIIVFCATFFPILLVFIYFYLDILKIAWSHQRRIEQAMQVSSRCLLPGRYWGHFKAIKTVTVLVGCFTLCWSPFFVVSIIQVLCPLCKLYWFLENHLWLLGLANSLINPLVYAFWQREVFQVKDIPSPLTKVKLINELNEREAHLGIKDSVSWHAEYKDSAWIFIGGFPYELTEGDIICVFSQYGEIANINLVRDKKTGKSKGFCFLCYEDQRSTILAVDNFNGIKIKGRTLRVDHVSNYRPPKDTEDIDDITKSLRQEGCAPKTASSSGSESEDEQILPLKKPKKEKKEKKKKKKKEKKKEAKGEKRMTQSDSPSTPAVKVKKEREDAGYEKYTLKGGQESRKERERAEDQHRRGERERDRDRDDERRMEKSRDDARRGKDELQQRPRERDRERESFKDRPGDRDRDRHYREREKDRRRDRDGEYRRN
ncbi:RNA-binding motif protein, X-linked 2 [Bagarius yarrelli]|uniref:RNA-binding motif protein, X-linked 2 n=1 Tax=Bagarius yarrelli TaxID=175774 RepID=A0A556UYL2_BAGYA|nr:RNA-binding motif protein, X-linked 2 [Bagarius yarrelli]